MKFPETYAKNKILNVIIETPYKSRNKFAYDEESGLFKLKKVIPAGLEFPCDMGFIPGTKGKDEDPLDALILMDEITYPGCLIECRLLGVIKAVQESKKGEKVRNDRFIVVPDVMNEYDHLNSIKDLNANKLLSIVSFFKDYNKKEKKKFKLLDILDSDKAHSIIKKYRV